MQVVLLHGLAGSRQFFRDLESRLRAAGHKTLSFDLLGFGTRRAEGQGYTLDEHLGFIDAEIEKGTGQEAPLALIGHSLGGVLAMAWALRNPKRVSRMVLLNVPLAESSADMERSLRQEKGIGWAYFFIAHRGVSRLLCALLCQTGLFHALKPFKPSFVPDRVFDDYPNHAFRSLSRTFEEVAIKTPGLPLLRSVEDIPVLRLVGNADLDACRRRIDLPRVTTVMLPGHHYLSFEQPGAVAQTIEEFLKETRIG